MGACHDRGLIFADWIAGAGGECPAFNHQVAPVLQAVEPGTRPPCVQCCVCFRDVVIHRLALSKNRARAKMYASALQ